MDTTYPTRVETTDLNIAQSDVPAFEAERSRRVSQLFARKPDWVQGGISKDDALFLSGLLGRLKPARIAEIGVASGWSSLLMLSSLHDLGLLDGAHIYGVDLSKELYTDKSRSTGSVIGHMVPELAGSHTLITGLYSFQAMPQVGEVDFAFIDAHHMHPWATLDLVATLPFLPAGAWVALHDINLCGVPRHQHRNRAPYYLYHLWKGGRINSSVAVPMIGAIRLDRNFSEMIDDICEILATPWELTLTEAFIKTFLDFTRQHLGEGAAEKIGFAIEVGNVSRRG